MLKRLRHRRDPSPERRCRSFIAYQGRSAAATLLYTGIFAPILSWAPLAAYASAPPSPAASPTPAHNRRSPLVAGNARTSQTAPQNSPTGITPLAGAQIQSISSNPGASDLLPGSGLLGTLLGFGPKSGVRVGGLWIGNADYLFTGGAKPRTWSFNSLLVVNLNLDLDKLVGLPGSSIDAAVLQFNGEAANRKAGVVQGYDGLVGPKPLDRTQLYELWWRQSLFRDKLIIRFGKTVPTYDFNNVSRPVPVTDASLAIPSITALLYTPIFKNPTLIGAAPGYYNSAYGVTANLAPSKNFYFTYALYDGELANGVQSGLRVGPAFDGHYFTIGEAGYAWILSPRTLPGLLAAGGWTQTGRLQGPVVTQQGSSGAYAFGSQRLWQQHPGKDNSGVSGFFQFGFNDSRTMIANRYAGLGVTGFGLVRGRLTDTMGAGLAWSWLNRRYGFRSNEAILQTYYQAHLIGGAFLEPALSYIPNPGAGRRIQGALAMTVQLTVQF